MRKLIVFIIVFSSIVFSPITSLQAKEYPKTYELYMELGKKAVENEDYVNALNYFEYAQIAYPLAQEPLEYINFIKRLQEGRVEYFPRQEKSAPETIVDDYKDVKPPIDKSVEESPSPKEVEHIKSYTPREVRGKAREQKKEAATVEQPVISPVKEQRLIEGANLLYMNDELWISQPRTKLEIEMEKEIILEGDNIERFLIITPDFIEVEQISRDQIKIVTKRRGLTFLHVWDNKGRWTFSIEVVLPFIKEIITPADQQKVLQEDAKPFRVTYSNDWSNYYSGDSFTNMERQNLNFIQSVAVDGPTPYGDFDSNVRFSRIDKEMEITRRTIGLRDGHIGPFEGFHIRGFDVNEEFSPLSLPGQTIRGGLIESPAFNDLIEYSYVRGRDRQGFGILSAENNSEDKAYIEGGQLTFFPKEDNQYSINFARGWGEDRENFLADRVVSLEAQRRVWLDSLLFGEIAYDDGNNLAKRLGNRYENDKFKLNVNLRDLDKEFTTIVNRPTAQGETGGNINFNWDLGAINWSSYLDLHRERLFTNPDDPKALNWDLNSIVDHRWNENQAMTYSVYYVDTPGELSVRRSLQANTNYSHLFLLPNEKTLSTFLRGGYQRSRAKFSDDSDYDRYTLATGFRLPIFVKGLSFNSSYEHSWVEQKLAGPLLTPAVWVNGLDYGRNLTKSWYLNSSLSYRDEERTEGINSFLAGEDSLTGGLGLSFRPTNDFEYYIDGRVRDIWGEGEDQGAFNEFDIRTGVRTGWNTPLSWNPTGIVEGYVYKDLNGNQERDDDEQGIPDVLVKVGKKDVITNNQGKFYTKVFAKKVRVGIDVSTAPDGFILSTPVYTDVEIIPQKVQKVNIGLNTQSGIYGVVYYDINGNGQPDSQDEFIRRVRIVLDGDEVTVSDGEGAYFFRAIQAGIHNISIDLNSIPLEYIPKIKLKHEIEVNEGTTYILHVPVDKKVKK